MTRLLALLCLSLAACGGVPGPAPFVVCEGAEAHCFGGYRWVCDAGA